MPSPVETISTAIGAAVGGLLVGGFAAWKRAQGKPPPGDAEARRHRAEGMMAAYGISSSLTRLRTALKAHRVVLLKAVERPDRRMIGRVLNESTHADAQLDGAWHNYAVEPWYRGMVLGLQPNAPRVISRAEVADDALRSIYERDGIVSSVVLLVHAGDDRYLYVSINLKRPVARLTATELVRLASERSTIWSHAKGSWGQMLAA